MNAAPKTNTSLDMNTSLQGDFDRDGYVVVRGAFSAAEVDEINTQAELMIRENLPELARSLVQQTPFDQLEPPYTSVATDTIFEQVPAVQYPHKISNYFKAMLSQASLVECLTQLIGPNVKCMQSIYFAKKPGTEGQAWHQDEFFIPTRDTSLVAAWIACDQVDEENGCLWVLPGSHQSSVLFEMKEIDPGDDFNRSLQSTGYPYDSRTDAVPVEVEAGDVVFFSGHLLHASTRNRSEDRYRRALVHHYMSAESWLPWFPGNDFDGRRQSPWDYRDVEIVAGVDPNAWKGKEELSKAYAQRRTN